MKFTKMHGIGNDYVYVNCFEEQVPDPERTAVYVSDRHFGIGSDGLILIQPSETADCRMDMYNLDGSRGMMCGNGVRCVGKYVYDHGLVPPDRGRISVETLSGIKYLDLEVEDGKVKSLTVDMGEPEILSREGEVLEMGEKRIPFTGISMGNPHSVIFLDQETEKMFADWEKDSRTAERRSGREAKTGLDCLDLPAFGPAFENHPRFLPQRTNTEFVEVCGENDLLMRVWERGSGETLACGTGACAVAVAAILAGYAQKDRDVKVDLLGGSLFIRWDSESGRVFMTGEAKEVFSGEIDLP